MVQTQPQKEPHSTCKDIDYNYTQTRTPTRRPQDEEQTLPADDLEWQDIEDRPREKQVDRYQKKGTT